MKKNMNQNDIINAFFSLLAISAPSGQEEEIAQYISHYLQALGCIVKTDLVGNVVGFLPGNGEAVLLTAHMDRVPPGIGNIPMQEANVLKSNGTTNLGADDAAGITIILEAVKHIVSQNLPHPPLDLVFTVGEEIGLKGARALDPKLLHAKHGICFDNAFEAGVVISQGATYEGFDIEIIGKATHPGKDISQGTNALAAFLNIDWQQGESEDKKSRLNIGTVQAGVARNVVPEKVSIRGELRTMENDNKVHNMLKSLEEKVSNACQKYGATYSFYTHRHSSSYTVDLTEPLVQQYKKVVENRQGIFVAKPTFVGSDTNALRAEKGLHVFTVSTGVVDEHTVSEQIKISDLVQLTTDLVELLTTLSV